MVMMRVEHCEKDGCYEGMIMVRRSIHCEGGMVRDRLIIVTKTIIVIITIMIVITHTHTSTHTQPQTHMHTHTSTHTHNHTHTRTQTSPISDEITSLLNSISNLETNLSS